MNKYSPFVWLCIALMALTIPACGFSASTANISDATMARDEAGSDPTTTFSAEDTFYCIAELANAPDDTAVRAVWTVVDAEGADPNTMIDEASITQGDGQIAFDLANDGPWPVGSYKVELFLNDEQEPAQTLEFEVQ